MVSVSTSRLNLHFFKLLHAPPSTLTRFNCFFTSIFYRKYTSWAHSADTHWGPQVGGGGWIMYSPLLKDADWCQPRLVPACAGPGMLSRVTGARGPGARGKLSTEHTLHRGQWRRGEETIRGNIIHWSNNFCKNRQHTLNFVTAIQVGRRLDLIKLV